LASGQMLAPHTSGQQHLGAAKQHGQYCRASITRLSSCSFAQRAAVMVLLEYRIMQLPELLCNRQLQGVRGPRLGAAAVRPAVRHEQYALSSGPLCCSMVYQSSAVRRAGKFYEFRPSSRTTVTCRSKRVSLLWQEAAGYPE
jgi:hypothetical protein